MLKNILIKYWGYTSFRPLQEEIISAVLEGKDTLALLPTGGGKSICFQLPALSKEGLCIVVSPLIALMKDQVDRLKKRGIKAIAVHSGMHSSEVDVALNNAMYGDVKFLYVSPERLETEVFKERIVNMPVNLLAIDEAHCISQWGYDFRPPYLNIANIRSLIPHVPVVALTATATPEVVKDIQEKLLFKKENVFQSSFLRKNLSYMVFKEEDKLARLLRVIQKIKGVGIVYVRNRRKTEEIAVFLKKNKVPAAYYHAGMSSVSRDEVQGAWMKEKLSVIVATNAFGMGIDKPNVRFVIHLDLPDCLESYFQESGRAGRDEKKSYAVLMYNDADIINSNKQLLMMFPELDQIKAVYQALGNYFQIAVGAGKDEVYNFDIDLFCKTYKFSPALAFNSLRFLEKEGYVLMTDLLFSSSKIHFNISNEDLYRFQVENVYYDPFIKVLLRSYSGLFSDFINVSEVEIAHRANIEKAMVEKYLTQLHKLNIITYIPQKQKPQLVYTTERVDTKQLHISDMHYHDLKAVAQQRMKKMIQYVSSTHKCRSQQLLSYFGEHNSKRCGVCDVCIERNKIAINEQEFDRILEQIKPMLQEQACTMEQMVSLIKDAHEDKVISVVQWLMDNQKISKGDGDKLIWVKG